MLPAAERMAFIFAVCCRAANHLWECPWAVFECPWAFSLCSWAEVACCLALSCSPISWW
jgi:hypothetical protein